jgi:DNA-directed RNA polymerase subunit E'/Rpb7
MMEEITTPVFENSFIVQSPYINTILYTTVAISPDQLNNNLYLNMKENLIKKLEKKCYGKYGYVVYVNKILEYKGGVLNAENFNADAMFDIKFSCKLCSPLKNTFIVCQVETITRAIIRVFNGPILAIITGERYNENKFAYDSLNNIQYNDDKKYKNLQKNDFVKITLISTKFSDGDERIIAIGFLNDMASTDDIKEYYDKLYKKDMAKIEYNKYIEQEPRI